MPIEKLIEVSLTETPIRLDSYLTKHELGLSRNYIQQLIEDGQVLIKGKQVKSSYKVSPGEAITLHLPDPAPLDLEAENIPLDIIYEDDQLIVINKPSGMITHPAAGVSHGTLVNALLYHCKNLSGIGGVQRPGIVHRIDKGTSGLIMAAKTDLAHQSLSTQLKQRTILRKYLTLVYGYVKVNEGFIETQIGRNPQDRKKMAVLKEGGRIAGTHYHVLKRYQGKFSQIQGRVTSFTYLECKLTTGRTHQIRVHLAHIHYPVVGDEIYGKGRAVGLVRTLRDKIEKLNGYSLHAQLLGFVHPVTKEKMEFSIEPPPAFQELMNYLGK